MPHRSDPSAEDDLFGTLQPALGEGPIIDLLAPRVRMRPRLLQGSKRALRSSQENLFILHYLPAAELNYCFSSNLI